MSAKKMSPMDWGYKHAKNFKRKKEELSEKNVSSDIEDYLDSCSTSDYTVGHWTILKHIILGYCLNPFGVILDRNNITNTIYLDLFCGAGVSPIKESDSSKLEWIVGSPIIATQMTDYPFSKYYFNDINKKSVELTGKILEEENSLQTNPIDYSLMRSDANDAIDEIFPDIENSYVFAFIDPSGFQWNWNSMESLFELGMFDIILNFQTRQVERLPVEKVETFFGPCAEKVNVSSNCDEKLDLYIEQIKSIGLNVIPIRIGMDRTDQYYYHLLHISRKRSYEDIILDVKDRIERFNGETIKMIWNDLQGKVKQSSFELE